ncbi:rhodanese-like domain-containing protein [Streptomyces sp. NPDC058092]|uniref:rhodanese-like domain-containing protein n=1 Tax=Streptomyces sp. NPDC058092 TaxID=3346336 RepID=UPI0036F051FA
MFFADTLAQDRTAVLIDVRVADEYRTGHAPGAVHAPLPRLSAGAADAPGADQHRRIVRRSGHCSRRAPRLLAERPVSCVDVRGGMKAWSAAGLTVHNARGLAGTAV